jgi:hypothetical protein
MDFIEDLRRNLGISTKYKFSKILRKSPQAYETLILAKDRIQFRDLIALRRVCGLTDTALLDLVEKEIAAKMPEVYEELPKKHSSII